MNYLRNDQYQTIMLNLSNYIYFYTFYNAVKKSIAKSYILFIIFCYTFLTALYKSIIIYIYIKNNIKKLNQYNHNGALLS